VPDIYQAIADAVAGALATVSVGVRGNEGCIGQASGSATASAIATALAQAYSRAAADACGSVADASSAAMSEAFARAAAYADASVAGNNVAADSVAIAQVSNAPCRTPLQSACIMCLLHLEYQSLGGMRHK
jgi:hypothetical protein